MKDHTKMNLHLSPCMFYSEFCASAFLKSRMIHQEKANVGTRNSAKSSLLSKMCIFLFITDLILEDRALLLMGVIGSMASADVPRN